MVVVYKKLDVYIKRRDIYGFVYCGNCGNETLWCVYLIKMVSERWNGTVEIEQLGLCYNCYEMWMATFRRNKWNIHLLDT